MESLRKTAAKIAIQPFKAENNLHILRSNFFGITLHS